jgi:hypothetical protein
MLGDDELFAAPVAPQDAHFLELRRLLPTLTLQYGYCLQLLNFSSRQIVFLLVHRIRPRVSL